MRTEAIPVAKKTKAEMKQTMTRIVCLVLAGLMIGSVLLAAVMSQVF